MESFGDYLRDTRQKRVLTLGQLSLRSGVSKATLSRWESGTHSPRIPELSRVLDALGASPVAIKDALRLLDVPRAVLATRGDYDTPMTLSLGDFLFGLRQRSGKTQAQAAGSAGVSRSLYAQWEHDAGQPTPGQLHAAAFALGASASEVVILTTRRFARMPMERSRDALLEQYKASYEFGTDRSEAVQAPRMLSLIAHAARLLRDEKADVGDLALFVADYAGSLEIWRGDVAASASYQRRAIALAGQSNQPLHFHLVNTARVILDPKMNPRPLRERVADALAWRPRFRSNAGKSYLLSFIARALATEAPDEAMRLADEYCALVADDPSEYPCRQRDRGNLLLKCGRAAESVAFIATLAPQDAYREGLREIEMAQGLVVLESFPEARVCVQKARLIFARDTSAFVNTEMSNLERALS